MPIEKKRFVKTTNGVEIAVREGGTGEDVALFHCSAGSGRQWERLADELDNCFHLIAPDLIGYGSSSEWPGHGPLTLAEHARAMMDVLGDSDGLHLVGHSYGGALALRVALELGPRLQSLTLIEPSAFHLLRRGDAGEVGFWYEISSMAADVWHGARSGDFHGGMARFIDYWSGPGAWNDLNEDMQARLAAQVNTVATDFAVLFSELGDLSDLARIGAPVLILQGTRSPGPSRRLCAMLGGVLPDSRLHTVEGAGHMSPLTHADQVNGYIRDHLFEHGRREALAAA